MAAVNFEQNLAADIDNALDGPIEMVIGTWAAPDNDEPFDLYRLRLARNVAGEFRDIGHRHIQQLLDSDVIPFDPGFDPDDNRVMRLPMADFDEPAVIERILDPGGLPFFNLEESGSVAFHCFVARREDTRAGFLHRASSVVLARRNRIVGLIADNTVSRLDADVLTFGPIVHMLLEPEALWVSNFSAFRSLFRTMPILLGGVQVDLNTVTAHVPVANIAEFQAACSSDPRMMAKLASVARRPYLAALTPQRIRQVVRRYHLPAEVMNAQGQLVHDNSPRRRWLVLRILDDSYLESLMTRSHYEVNSKLPMN